MSEITRQQQVVPAIEAKLEHLLAAGDVPGLALANVRAGQLESPICCGKRDVRTPFRVDGDTVFDAASLSKPVFAHIVLQLMDGGVLSLDAPLADYLPVLVRYVVDVTRQAPPEPTTTDDVSDPLDRP